MKFAIAATTLALVASAVSAADIPTVAAENGSFNTLLAAVGAAGLTATMSSPGPFTVFAPTDDAFAALPEGLVDCLLIPDNAGVLGAILSYHALLGSVLSTDLVDGMTPITLQGESVTVSLADGVKINESTVIIADVAADNGVIHAIDSVLVPPSIDVDAFLATCPGSDMAETDMAETDLDDIPTVATENGSFNTLVAALGAGDLVGTLSSEGPFTVFAPTDDAFAALPEGLVDCLLIPDNVGTLRTILTYHVLSGSFLSTDLVDGTTPATVQGESVTVSLGDSVKINESTVIIADVPASNGVIHAVDAVLVPPSINVAAFLDACPSDDTGDTGTGSENRGDEETGDAGDDADIITTGTIAPTPIPTGRNNPLNNGGNIFAQLQWLFSFLGRSNNNVPRNPPESTPDRPLPPRSIFRFAGRNGSATRVIPNNIMV